DDPLIVKKAQEIVGDEKNPLHIAEKLCGWVSANMRNVFSARLSNSLEVLKSMEGDCTEHTVLFVGLARAAGLPAKMSAGLIYVNNEQPGFYFHQWACVWLGEWIDVDPAFNQVPIDVTHIKFAEGDLFRQAKILPLIGRIQIKAVDERLLKEPQETSSDKTPV
ncbi:MAG: transglutaminase domain-containing protein, partial [Candidatus Hydrogenedentes bacterium]|nr:transglutaminase domain-containing protein [Candidatus Hydrogenedentota bacterium]